MERPKCKCGEPAILLGKDSEGNFQYCCWVCYNKNKEEFKKKRLREQLASIIEEEVEKRLSKNGSLQVSKM